MGLFLSIGLLLSLIIPTSSQAEGSFRDVPTSHRFYEEIGYLTGEKIITGFPDGSFRPETVVNRAQAAIMIGRVLGLNETQRSTGFKDVPLSSVASGYIASAVEKGIIQGFPDKTYRPNESVTRGQMAIFLSRAFKLIKEADTPFTDITPSMQSYSHIRLIVAENLTQGYEDNTFRPNLAVTRAQFSAFLARALDDQFKVKLLPAYLKNPNKIYHYQTSANDHFAYKYSDVRYSGWNLWDVYWEDEFVYSIVERQDSQGYKSGTPYSEYTLMLANPVVVGHKWFYSSGGETFVPFQITGTNMTVTTPAGTFHNVVEVTTDESVMTYYAPNVGMIKIMGDGETIEELTKIENR
jgi:hypothetical protein